MSLLPYLYLGLESLILFIVSGRRFGSLGFFAFLFAWLMLVGLTGLASVLAPVSKLLFLIGIGTALLLLTASLTSAAKFPIRLQKISSKFLTGFMVLSLSTYIPFGTIEWIARAMTDSGHWNYFQPLQVVAANHEDWRLFHVTTNQGVEADPVLFWQPRAFRPYTHQRMRGPTAIIPKPPGLYRVMTYGDSNTEGPPEGGAWAERLGNLLKQKGLKNHPQVELINAGVTGYSSYQGLQRFKQQVETFQPDLILVSFGWNDASPAMGKTDKEFLPPNATVANLLRNLYRFRFFLVLKEKLRPQVASPAPATAVGVRVPLADYAANLQGFWDEAHKHRVKVVFLTRPHRPSEQELIQLHLWRSEVPAYNRTIREFTKNHGAALVDVQQIFSNHPDLFSDECHFTQSGHEKLAEILYGALGSIQ